MAASLEDTLISVWRQPMVEGAKTVTLEGRDFPVRMTIRSRLRQVDFRFEVTNCVGSNRILRQLLAGRDWRAKERRSCNFSADDATLLFWWTERCSSTGKRG